MELSPVASEAHNSELQNHQEEFNSVQPLNSVESAVLEALDHFLDLAVDLELLLLTTRTIFQLI